MIMIEPNISALCLFAVFASLTSLGFFVMSGAFPLATRPELSRPLGLALIVMNTVLLCLAIYGTLAFGLTQLRWTSVIIVGGLAFLFAPALFNLWPGKWRDGLAGLAIVALGLGGSVVSLQALA